MKNTEKVIGQLNKELHECFNDATLRIDAKALDGIPLEQTFAP